MQQEIQQDQGIYQALLYACQASLRETAIDYFGRVVTYRGLLTQTERAARAFLRWGVRRGDAVLLCSTATPELLYALMALWKLGAVPHLISPGQGPEQMAECIEKSGASLFLLLDQFAPYITFSPGIGTQLQTILLQATQSMPFLARAAAAKALPVIEVEPNSPRRILWKEFLESGQSILSAPAVPLGGASPVLVVYSADETGEASGMTHRALCVRMAGMAGHLRPWGPRRKLLCVLPPWHPEGVACGLLAPLCLGLTVVMEPRIHAEAFVLTLLREKPTHLVADNGFWLEGMDRPELLCADLAFLHTVTCPEIKGVASEEKAARIAAFLRARCCRATLQII